MRKGLDHPDAIQAKALFESFLAKAEITPFALLTLALADGMNPDEMQFGLDDAFASGVLGKTNE